MSSQADLATIVKNGAPHPLRKWLIIAVILVAGGVTAAFLHHRHTDHDTAVEFVTEPIRRGDLPITITATGNLKPTNQVSVGSELSGTVLEVFVEANARVTKKQQLARLDTNKLTQQTERTRATLALTRAKVSQAEATLRETQAKLKRLQDLHRLSDGKTPSQGELDTALAASDRGAADLQSAQAAVAEAEAAVRTNETDLNKAIIRSPVDGIVLTRKVEPGQTVAAQFTAPELFVIAENLETMELQVAVAEADIGKVEVGQNATFIVDAWPDRQYSAVVKRVAYGSTVTANVVTYETKLSVQNPDLSLRPGMTATVDIKVSGREDVLLVPSAALRFKPPQPGQDSSAAAGPKKSFVQTILPSPPRRRMGGGRPPVETAPPKRPGEGQIWILREGKPVEVTVRTGLSDGRLTEISGDGFAEGDAVIIRQSTSVPS